MIKNVILDWSGTVVDDLAPVIRATNAVMSEHGGTEFTIEEFRREFCLPLDPFYRKHLSHVPWEILDEAYHRHFQNFSRDVALLPGVEEFLKQCRALKRRLFVLSTITPSLWDEQAKRFGIGDFFEHAYTGIPDKRRKIAEVLKMHGLEPGETLFAGDMVHDIQTAKSAGILSVALLTGFDTAEKLASANPDLIARDLGVLSRLLKADPIADHGMGKLGAIRISGLQIDAVVGVPEEERAKPQRLLLDITVIPQIAFDETADDIARTVDYFVLSERIRAHAAAGEWRLIEWLAADLRDLILATPLVAAATVRVRKFILPYAEEVSVEM
ncbi:MAG TPA: dihydroneopterin aldolase [Chthoniobacterales bacterium]